MNVIPSYLSLEVRTADGLATEFYQSEPKLIRETLRLLCTPRLFTQPQLFIASDRSTTAFAPRSIDVILARTDAAIESFLPLRSPAGLVDVFESHVPFPSADLLISRNEIETHPADSRVMQVQAHTLGGSSVTLEVRAQLRGTAQDRRQTFANFFTVPVIPFHLETGGIGLINPASLTCTSAWPSNNDEPETALPMNLSGKRGSRSELAVNAYSFQS